MFSIFYPAHHSHQSTMSPGRAAMGAAQHRRRLPERHRDTPMILYVSHSVKIRNALYHGRNFLVRGRDAVYPAPPAQIPACGTIAPGSCIGSNAEALLPLVSCPERSALVPASGRRSWSSAKSSPLPAFTGAFWTSPYASANLLQAASLSSLG